MKRTCSKVTSLLALVFVFGGLTAAKAQIVIYSDTLGDNDVAAPGGATENLYGTVPDTVDGNAVAPGTLGATWITYGNGSGVGTLNGNGWTRGNNFSDYEMSPTTYGTTASGNHNDAFLPFAPVSGDSYTLTVDLKGNQGGNFDTLVGFTSTDTPNGGGGPNWGFGNDNDGVVDTGDNSENEAFLAGGTTSVQTGTFTDGFHGNNPFSDPMQLAISLDSTGSNTWSVSAVATDTITNNVLFSTGTYDLTTNDIQYLGFYSEENVTDLSNLTLVQDVPEPSTWALMGAGLLALAFFQRRRLRD